MASLSQNIGDPHASTLHQYAYPNYPKSPNPLPIAPQAHYESIVDRPIAEPTKSHQQTCIALDRSTGDLPPLIGQSSHSRTSSTSQLSIIPQLDSSPHLNSCQPSPQLSRQSSPTRSNRLSIRTGKSDPKAGKLAGWFKGESEPISIGIIPSPTKEKADPLNAVAESSDARATNLLQRLSTTQVVPKPAMASRFSFFSSKASLVKSTPLPDELSDELLGIDVKAALFPNEPANPFSPASFKNLQQQAEGLLSRLQTAYKERTIALRDIIAEKETLAEESAGTETRVRHLKMQLDGMTAKFAEQDEAMMNLVDELAQEKQARREDEEARKRTIRVVGDVSAPNSGHRGLSRSNTVSDSGFESEDDSSADSVFSRRNGAQSPVTSVSSASTANSPDIYRAQDFRVPASAAPSTLLRLPQGQPAAKGIPVHSCTNYDGLRASDAWSVVSILKEENEGLKHRVGELEGALDGCLDVVGRLS
ncbi:hypothetical protein IMSHALPRED_000041 [Imshaugia aleurites]|uniref:Uncharacterized protein n=1 Tax=Imshaugia aleurites TaxID=172621 RepID=A0A8H3EI45_9LECA|nr:hypothetical protein IMSHALPRED_000041 [Imshaugia aleurites]